MIATQTCVRSRSDQRVLRAQRYWDHVRPDYRSILALYLSSRRRFRWATLEKNQIDLLLGTLRQRINNGAELVTQLTPAELDLIWREWRHYRGRAVFSYVAKRGPRKGRRVPITPGGVESAHRSALKRAGLRPATIQAFKRRLQ